jgi:hypothetical protein
MENVGYVAKVNSMYVKEVYEYSEEITLIKNKYAAKLLKRDEIEWLKRAVKAKIIQVKISYEEVGFE